MVADRVFCPSNNEEQWLRRGLQWFFQRAIESGAGLLLVPTKSQLTDGQLPQVLGAATCKALSKGHVDINGARIVAATAHKSANAFQGGALVVVYGGATLLDIADDTHFELNGPIAIPWLLKEVMPWAQQWRARPLNEDLSLGPPTARLPLATDAIESFRQLSDDINLSTGLGHHSDHDHALDVLTQMNQHHPFDPEAIRQWAVGEFHWAPRHADTLFQMAQRIKEGRPPRRRS